MPENRKTSFTTEKCMRYAPEFDVTNCEKVHQADVDGDGCMEIVVVRGGSSRDRSGGELAVYDLDLNLKASDCWSGTAMDVVIADVDGDGEPEIIVAGGLKSTAPMIRVYKYNESYKDNLQLSAQISWKAPEGLISSARAVHVFDMDADDGSAIAVLAIAEGNKENTGYAQLRLYDADMELKSIARWTPMNGQIVKWGHCMTAADVDGDGRAELVALINFRHDGKQKADLRAFDEHLILKEHCRALADESLFATRMAAADIDRDGRAEIVITGGAFTQVWQGATNQLMVFDGGLELRSKTTWKTFRHSWVWDLQIADIDGDGRQELVTYGGASMGGRNQDSANIMGEICIWDSRSLSAKDMFIWRTQPGEDTRPSRGFALRDEGHTRFAVATSRWSREHFVPELEIRTLKYEPLSDVIEQYSALAAAYRDKNIEALAFFIDPADTDLSPIALDALATCGSEAAEAMSRILSTRYQPLLVYAIELLRDMGAIDELRGIGSTITDDWAIVSPFDNRDNEGFGKQYPPEIQIDLNAFYAGKDRIVRWAKIEESEWENRRGIYVDLAYNHFHSFERTGIEHNWNTLRTRSVAYALTHIHSPALMEAQIRIGSTDGVKVWLNGELKHSSDKNRSAVPEQDTIPVSLVEGENRLLLKIANHKSDGWGFYLRVTNSEGNPIPDLHYERPEASHTHNQMLTNQQLISLLDAQDERLRCLAADQLASIGDKRGNETLFHLSQSQDAYISAKASLALTMAGDGRCLDTMVESVSGQNYHLQVAASYALRRAGDPRAEQFSISNLVDETGKNILEPKVTDRDNGFRVALLFRGDETAHLWIGTDGNFHLGDNISARHATIGSFGIREPRYRAMGLGSIAIKRACEIMAERGFSCSTVSTGTRLVAHRLYIRHGYVDRRFPWEYSRELKEEDVVENCQGIGIRDYAAADRADVNRLRDQYISNAVGPANWKPRSNFGAWIKVAEADGKIIGYTDVYLDPFEPRATMNLLHIDTAFPDEPEAVQELILGAQRYALVEGKKSISFRDPPMRYRDILQGMGYNISSNTLRHGWVNMFKVIDLAKFLSEIPDLLSLRLQRSVHAGWAGSIGIKGTRLKATIVVDGRGDVNVEDAADSADICIVADDGLLTSLVSGDGDIWEWYRQHTLTVEPMFNERIRTLIEALFPVMGCRQGGWW